MEFIIIPTEVFEQADMTLAKKLGLNNPRKSVDGNEVIMHVESYNRLFGETTTARKARSRVVYPIYDSDSEAFKELLNSEEWISEELID